MAGRALKEAWSTRRSFTVTPRPRFRQDGCPPSVPLALFAQKSESDSCMLSPDDQCVDLFARPRSRRIGGAKVLLAGVCLWSLGTLVGPPSAKLGAQPCLLMRASVRWAVKHLMACAIRTLVRRSWRPGLLYSRCFGALRIAGAGGAGGGPGSLRCNQRAGGHYPRVSTSRHSRQMHDTLLPSNTGACFDVRRGLPAAES